MRNIAIFVYSVKKHLCRLFYINSWNNDFFFKKLEKNKSICYNAIVLPAYWVKLG